jgi:hypothetical protein
MDNNESIGIKDLRAMLESQCYRCALTGEVLTPDNCALDHIIPLCRGGTHTKDNVQLVTAVANKAKGGLCDDEFIQLCRIVVAYADNKIGRCHEISTGPWKGASAEGRGECDL